MTQAQEIQALIDEKKQLMDAIEIVNAQFPGGSPVFNELAVMYHKNRREIIDLEEELRG
jgi:hypothetical protein